MLRRHSTLRVPAACRPGSDARAATLRAETQSIEEYVEGIYRLQEDVHRVTTGQVAEYMAVSPGSATTMIKRLHELGYVRHQPYQGLTLTEQGRALALRLVRAHRVLEVYLQRSLGLDWHEVHDIACRLEHHLSDEQIDMIWEKIGRPRTCPHGNPVEVEAALGDAPLAEAETDVPLRVTRITDERTEFLHHLRSIGLVPGTRLRLVGRGSVDSIYHLERRGERLSVGPEVAFHVWVLRD
ncbi:MAG: metal-dependent transcriptional regulator [Fimbriimonadales bacterium]|nr:metal-dependent transcriptional regulator [Fimbriimonadales bacterium]